MKFVDLNSDIGESFGNYNLGLDKEIILVGLAASELIKAGKDIGLKVASEVFTDRAYKNTSYN